MFGDITKKSTDAIVVPEAYTFESLGVVGEALVEMEPKFKEKREKLIRKLDLDKAQWKAFATKLGKPFKHVLHAVLLPLDHCKSVKDWKQSMYQLYFNVLQKAEEKEIKSLALPLLGSGKGGTNIENAINVALDAVIPFKQKHLKWIIVVSQQKKIFDAIVSQYEMRLSNEQPDQSSEGKRESVTEIEMNNNSSIGSTAISKIVKSPCFQSLSVEEKENCHHSCSKTSSKGSSQRNKSKLTSDGKLTDCEIENPLGVQTHPKTKTLPPEQSRILKYPQPHGGAGGAVVQHDTNTANGLQSQGGQPAPVRKINTGSMQKTTQHDKLSMIEIGHVREDTGRGNCMFVSLSKQLNRILHQDIGHSELRVNLVQYLRDNPYQPDNQPYSDFLTEDESWERFLERMSRDGQWGDHVILQATAELYAVEIIVIDDKNDQISVKPSRPCSYQLLLRFSHGRHYESIE